MNPDSPLRAGAGRAIIELPEELFPTEGFTGVHDPLHARALLLDGGTRIAVISLELVSIPDDLVVELRNLVGETAGCPAENVLICVTHTFSAPHALPAHLCKSPADQQKRDLLVRAIKAAVDHAALHAVRDMRAARFGWGVGSCDVNVNRDVLTADGWWIGSNETGPSDKTVTVLRFETLQGAPIALLFSYCVQPSVMDEPQTTPGRLVTADLAGAASTFLEREYGGTVKALFCLGAAADQAPSIKGAKLQYVGINGQIRVEDIHDEQGFIIAEMLGKRLGIEVLHVSEKMDCRAQDSAVSLDRLVVRCPGKLMQGGLPQRPATRYEFVPAEDRDEPVAIIRIRDIALVGVRPELCCLTAASMREDSPFHGTAVLTMVNGGAKYMPDESAYDRITYEAMNSPFARGAAELLCQQVVEALRR